MDTLVQLWGTGKKIYIGGEMNTKNALVMLNTQKPWDSKKTKVVTCSLTSNILSYKKVVTYRFPIFVKTFRYYACEECGIKYFEYCSAKNQKSASKF